jgi:hypothetical protein
MADKELIEFFGALMLLEDYRHLSKFDRLLNWLIGATMLFKPDWFEEFLD